jgi:hypothetical protein
MGGCIKPTQPCGLGHLLILNINPNKEGQIMTIRPFGQLRLSKTIRRCLGLQRMQNQTCGQRQGIAEHV